MDLQELFVGELCLIHRYEKWYVIGDKFMEQVSGVKDGIDLIKLLRSKRNEPKNRDTID